MQNFCHGQLAVLRLTVFALLTTVLLLLWYRPDISKVSLTKTLHIDSYKPQIETAEEQFASETEKIEEEVIPETGSIEEETDRLDEHPIKTLSKNAALNFERMLKKQSKTFKQAEAEYKRRYKKSPPPGFHQWFEYAKAEGSLIIDEFDMIDEAIKPFLQSSGAEITEHIQQVVKKSAWSWTCKIEKGRMHKSCGILGDEIRSLFSDVRVLSNIPDVEFVMNGLDEPRILLKQELQAIPSRLHRRTRSQEPMEWLDLTNQNAWKELAIDRCNNFETIDSGGIDGMTSSRTINTLGMPFVQNTSDSMNICQHPEYEHLHGFWESSASLHYTHSPLPILSPATLSTMNDIPFPAIAYTQGTYSYDEGEVLDYSQKKPGLYWAGKTTGGYQQEDLNGWIPLHRQRFVAVANDIEHQPYTFFQRAEDGKWEAVEDRPFNHASYHVYFTDVVQCDDAACAHQKEYFDIKKPEGRGESAKWTLVFDADGNGHSARYYRLLESKSLPLKQTVFREWHDERLQPWLHFIPISLMMDELPEVVRYLVEEEEGRELAKELAIKGREWSLKVLRPVDQFIYLYRLLLELARLQDPKRPAQLA